jgi:hypothetical protein
VSSSVSAHAVVATAAMLQSEGGATEGSVLSRASHVDEPVTSTFEWKTSISQAASGELPGSDAIMSGAGSPGALSSDTRIAQFASLAEQRDLRGLEAAIGDSSAQEVEQQQQQVAAEAPGFASGTGAAAAGAAAASSSLSHPSSSKSGGLHVSLTNIALPPASTSPLASPGTVRAMQQQHAQAAVMSLTVMERDVLQVSVELSGGNT